MADEDFLNLMDAPVKSSANEGIGVSSGGEFTPLSSPHIFERVFMQSTSFRFYPDGKIFIGKTLSWWKDKQIIQTKKKKEPIKAAEVKLQETESY